MPRSPSLWDVWTWPLAAGARAGELAFRTLGEFWASSEHGEPKGPEPLFATPNQTVLELTTLRVRDFSHGHHGPPTVIVARSRCTAQQWPILRTSTALWSAFW